MQRYFFVGGLGPNDVVLRTAEELTDSDRHFDDSFELPMPLYEACFAMINRTHGILAGGLDDSHVARAEAYLLDIVTAEWIDLPPMVTYLI